MGPLIPQNLINGDLNFFYAFVIGLAFGFILEQAGFSSSRKLAGVFYGYDFVVLKVFFTAGITAATGLFFLKYLGWIDFNFLYINPLYVWSALIGGIIMGFGFILGGFCPGTSIAAAVIGKIDAMVFIGGMFIGIFIFGMFYPVFEPLHMGNFLGTPFIYETLGLSQHWFLFFLILMAVMAFVVTQLIEDNSTKFKHLLNTQKLSIGFPLAFLLILAFTAIFIPTNRSSNIHENSSKFLFENIQNNNRYVSVEKVAYSIINSTNDFQLIDVRQPEEFLDFHLPGALNIPYYEILHPNFKNLLKGKDKTPIFYGNGNTRADIAWFLAFRAGYDQSAVLAGGLNGFFDILFGDADTDETTDIMALSHRRFIKKAQLFFKEGKGQELSSKPATIPDVIEVKAAGGGC